MAKVSLDTESRPAGSLDRLAAEWARERPDLDMASVGTLFRLRGLAMMMDELSDQLSASVGLKSAELYLLYAIRRGGAPFRMRPTDIYRLLRVTSGTITYRLDKLEREGLVRRIPDPEDRRSIVIELTAAGVILADSAIDKTVSAFGGAIVEALGSEDKCTEFNGSLSRLGYLLDQMLADGGNPLVRPKIDAGLGQSSSDTEQGVVTLVEPTRKRVLSQQRRGGR